MPGTTTEGLPYPLGSEPFADGADAIQALAEAIPSYTRMWAYAEGANDFFTSGVLTPVAYLTHTSSPEFDDAVGGFTYTGPDALFLVTAQVAVAAAGGVFPDIWAEARIRLGLGLAYPYGIKVRSPGDADHVARTLLPVSGLVQLGPSFTTAVRIYTRVINDDVDPSWDDGDDVSNSVRIVEIGRL